METTGDPVLDFIKAVAEHLHQLGVDWKIPKHFGQYPEDDQRDYTWNILEAYYLVVPKHRFPPPENIMNYAWHNGPRPPISG